MKSDAFELAEHIRLHTQEFKLSTKLWSEFDFRGHDTSSLVWKEIKYLNDSNDGFSDEINELPNDKGGIYMYIVKSPVLPHISDYLVYIGRAQYSANHSLRIRCKKYFNEFLREEERPLITKMIAYYKKYLYIKFCPINGNDKIIALEAELINALLPPFNHEIPEKKIRAAVKAF